MTNADVGKVNVAGEHGFLDWEKYQEMYNLSVNVPESFWATQAERITWSKPFSIVKQTSFNKQDFGIKWFADGELNMCFNCLDRHLQTRGNKVAVTWEGDDPQEDKTYTYLEVYNEVCKLANGLKSLGVKKGDRVTLYMPMIPEAAFAMLACARIGAVHSVVFGGFSPESLAARMDDCLSDVIITADVGMRGGKAVPLKANVDAACELCEEVKVKNVIVVKTSEQSIAMQDGRDIDYGQLLSGQSEDCPAEVMNAEDPLFILYTSGSTGKPKGVLHTTGGYAVFASLTFATTFDYRGDEIFWCTADVGWVTGHTYIVYGPLLNGAHTLMFAGVPTYPDAGRFWQVIEKHSVNIFYTAPTAIRALMRMGEDFVKQADRSSLRILGTVGEPINLEAWEWYFEVVGDSRCPIADTWWQTETGGHLITPIPFVWDAVPTKATLPFFGVKPVLIDKDGNEIEGAGEGSLCIADSWPGQMRTVYRDDERFFTTYFSTYPGYYFTGDGAERDEEGNYRITGRIDDVLNVSGHRMGTAELEDALDRHEKVSEAAVVGYPHDIKGQGIYAYCSLYDGCEPSEELEKELRVLVRKVIGPTATPDYIQFAPGLPKTRSGKIMRRILRKIAENEPDKLGDTSTLADPSVVDDLVNNRKNQ